MPTNRGYVNCTKAKEIQEKINYLFLIINKNSSFKLHHKHTFDFLYGESLIKLLILHSYFNLIILYIFMINI